MANDVDSADVLPLARTPSGHDTVVGWLVDWAAGEPVVDFHGNPSGPVVARTTVTLDVSTARQAVDARQGVVLTFEHGDLGRPIVLGLLQPTAELRLRPTEGDPLQVEVDGERREVEASKEIVLRCGHASITLRANGRVLIRGVYVETRALGTNRVKGGNVQIN